ncbi:helix-turn-helix domain-containing protein [Streptomyces sp. NBC_01260]|uniref:helix-turn-helix domain-containing protein n=1 Tax=unclassified Streptomyces TaxID=2593676 RepID=UPI00225656F7|nr:MULTISPECIES: helix-turn-helix transcriptional regulator [unclassified Streptomyces]MCX4771924.1 helix-turn-helix domain-containing protein [Streptomyces sp. NBC_01285]
MAEGTRRGRRPRAFVVGGVWPHAVMEPHRGALVVQVVARRLGEAMAEQKLSANALARKSGVNRQVIANVLNGEVWPDMVTLVDLEGALGVMLWPQHATWCIPAPGEAPDGVTDETL